METADRKPPTLLIVDDDADMRALLELDFRRQGYRILEASGGHEAFTLIQNGEVDVVVTDLLMPDGDGYELIDRIQSLCPECPSVVVVTGCTDLTAEELGDRGAAATFFKPYDRTSLRSSVRQLSTGARQA